MEQASKANCFRSMRLTYSTDDDLCCPVPFLQFRTVIRVTIVLVIAIELEKFEKKLELSIRCGT